MRGNSIVTMQRHAMGQQNFHLRTVKNRRVLAAALDQFNRVALREVENESARSK